MGWIVESLVGPVRSVLPRLFDSRQGVVFAVFRKTMKLFRHGPSF